MKMFKVTVVLPGWYSDRVNQTYQVRARDEEDAERRITDMVSKIDYQMAELIEEFVVEVVS